MSGLDNSPANNRNIRTEVTQPSPAEKAVPDSSDQQTALDSTSAANADLPAAIRREPEADAEISPRHATLQLKVALDSLRTANGSMTDLIDELASKSSSTAKTQEALQEKAIASSVWTEIVTGEVPGVRYSTELNIEGSLFFDSSQGEIRYRWRGGASRCDIYVGGHQNYFVSNGSDYVAPARIENTPVQPTVFSESEKNLDRRVKQAERQAEETYQKALETYNSTPQSIARFISGLIGKSEEAPMRATVSKEDMAVTIPEPDGRFTSTVDRYQTIATIATGAAEGIGNAHNAIRDRLNTVRNESVKTQ